MYRTIAFTTAVVTLVPVFFHHANALDIDSVKESPCVDIKSVPVDTKWATGVKFWYYPLMSRYDLYRMCTDVLRRDPKDIGEAQVYYDCCITSWHGGGKFFVKGFWNKTISYKLKPIRGMEEYYWEAENEGTTMKGTSYTSLTDNSTFIVAPSCIDGQLSLGVSTTVKRLPEETKNLIYDHAVSLGLKRDLLTIFRYENCPEGFERNQGSFNRRRRRRR